MNCGPFRNLGILACLTVMMGVYLNIKPLVPGLWKEGKDKYRYTLVFHQCKCLFLYVQLFIFQGSSEQSRREWANTVSPMADHVFIVEEQDKAYTESLAADREKECTHIVLVMYVICIITNILHSQARVAKVMKERNEV